MEDCIIAIDLSSMNLKVGLIDFLGNIIAESVTSLKVYEDGDFGKIFKPDELWAQIISGVKEVIKLGIKEKINPDSIVAISSDAQRTAMCLMKKRSNNVEISETSLNDTALDDAALDDAAFNDAHLNKSKIDEMLETFYCGPNKDTRGVDSQWIIDDEFEGEEGEKELFKITARAPPLIFGLARLLWFKEEDEESYNALKKVLTLDDWIVYKLTGRFVTDPASAVETQMFDVSAKKWSKTILEKFEIDKDWLPDVIESGTIVGTLLSEVAEEMNLSNNVKVIKSGADTQLALIGAGSIQNFDVGITLGSSAPIMVTLDKPIIDSEMRFWTSCHAVKDKWVLEANVGMTGNVYDWFKNSILKETRAAFGNENLDEVVCEHLRNTTPGSNSTFAYLGPELMDFKNQTDIKRSVFIFPSHGTISNIVSDRSTFTRAVIENIGFGIYENIVGLAETLSNLTEVSGKMDSEAEPLKSVVTTNLSQDTFNKLFNRIIFTGGMSKSEEIVQVFCDIIGVDGYIPETSETAYIGQLALCGVSLGKFKNLKDAISKLVKYKAIKHNPDNYKLYSEIYKRWKNYKLKIDDL